MLRIDVYDDRTTVQCQRCGAADDDAGGTDVTGLAHQAACASTAPIAAVVVASPRAAMRTEGPPLR